MVIKYVCNGIINNEDKKGLGDKKKNNNLVLLI